MDERDHLVHRVRRCGDEAHGRRDRGSQVVGVEDARRIGEADDDLVVAGAHRHGRVASRELLREPQGDFGVDLRGDEVDERELVLLGDEPSDVRRGHRAATDEDLAEALAPRDALLRECCVELLLGDDAVPDQECAQGRPRPRECHGSQWEPGRSARARTGRGRPRRRQRPARSRPPAAVAPSCLARSNAWSIADSRAAGEATAKRSGTPRPLWSASDPTASGGSEMATRREPSGRTLIGSARTSRASASGSEHRGADAHLGLGELEIRQRVLLRDELGDLLFRHRARARRAPRRDGCRRCVGEGSRAVRRAPPRARPASRARRASGARRAPARDGVPPPCPCRIGRPGAIR